MMSIDSPCFSVPSGERCSAFAARPSASCSKHKPDAKVKIAALDTAADSSDKSAVLVRKGNPEPAAPIDKALRRARGLRVPPFGANDRVYAFAGNDRCIATHSYFSR